MGKIVLGIFLCLLSLWGGAFLVDYFHGTAYHFPAMMTAVMVGCGGIFVFSFGVVNVPN